MPYKIPKNMSTGSKLFGLISWRIVMESIFLSFLLFALTLFLPLKPLLRIFIAILIMMSTLILSIALNQKEPMSKKAVRYIRFQKKRFIYIPIGYFKEKEFYKQRMKRMSDTEIYKNLKEGKLDV